MMIVRNGNFRLEELRVVVDNREYRVTGSPSIAEDKYALVEIFRLETMHGRKDRVRFGHWSRITSPKRREVVRQAALVKAGGGA